MSLIEKINKQQKEELERLIAWCGGVSNLAELLDVSVQVASSWKARGRISATSAAEAETQTKGEFTRSSLRPSVTEWRI